MVGAHPDNKFTGNTDLAPSASYKDLNIDFVIGVSNFLYLLKIDPDTPKSKFDFRLYEAFIFHGNMLTHSQTPSSSLHILKTGLPNDSEFFYITDTSEPELSRISLDPSLSRLQITQFRNLVLDFSSPSNLLDLNNNDIPGCLTELQDICLECAYGFQIDFSQNSCSPCADDDVFIQMGRFCETRKAVFTPDADNLRETYFPGTDPNKSTPNLFFISSGFVNGDSNKTNFWNSKLDMVALNSALFFTVKLQMFSQSSTQDTQFPGYILVSKLVETSTPPEYSIPIGFGHPLPNFTLGFSYSVMDNVANNQYNAFLQLPNYKPYSHKIIQSAQINYSDYTQTEFLTLLSTRRTEGHDHLSTICPDNFSMQLTALHSVKCVSKDNIDFGYTNLLTLPHSVIGCMQNCKQCDQSQQCIECEPNFFLSGSAAQCLPCDYNCSQCLGPTQLCESIVQSPGSTNGEETQTEVLEITSESNSYIFYLFKKNKRTLEIILRIE